MRTKTLVSLLVLCGSTAAFAHISTAPQEQTTTNNTTVENSTDTSNTTVANTTDSAPANASETAPPQD
jgi:hypothetical protein